VLRNPQAAHREGQAVFLLQLEGRRDASGTAVRALVSLAGSGQGQLIVNAHALHHLG